MPKTTYIWQPVLGNQVNFNLIDEWESITGSTVDYDFACPDLWTDPVASNVTINLDEEWVEPSPTEVDFDFYCGAPPVGDVIFDGFIVNYTGETSELDFVTAPIIYVGDFQTGETAEVEFETYPAAILEPDFYTGETLESALLRTPHFQVELPTGETFETDLDDHPAALLDPELYTGETIDADLQSSVVFGPEFSTGEYADSDLETEPNPGLDLDSAETGETSEVEIQTFHQFTTDFFVGETLTIGEIGTDPNYEAATGETTDASLSSSTTFEVEFSTGEYALASLLDSPQWQPEFDFYSGETANVDFVHTVVLSPRAHTGEYVYADLTDSPAPFMQLDAFVGESGAVTVQFSQQLGLVPSYAGETFEFTLTDDPNWEVKTGETFEFSLATVTTIDAPSFAGEHAQSILETRPSEGMGLFSIFEGTAQETVFATLRAVFLKPDVINAGGGTSAIGFSDQNEFTGSIDLNFIACCPTAAVDSDITLIEMSNSPHPSIRYDGDKTPVATVELTTAPRLVFEAVTGETAFTTPVNVFTGGFDAFDAQSVQTVVVGDVGIKLCTGNFLPDGGNILFEMSTPYNDNCDSYRAVASETATVEIQLNQGLPLEASTGERMEAVLTIDPILTFRAYTGETAQVRNLEFNLNAYTGESCSLEFFRPPYEASTGETAYVDLRIEYEVAFDEIGCLDNEFVPQDENGDPDEDAIRTVPVEMDQFVHSIRGRCF